MNTRRLLTGSLAALLIASLPPAALARAQYGAPYQPTTKPESAHTVARVKDMTIETTGATPQLRVKAKGDRYDSVDTDPFRVEYKLHAECTTVWDIHWLAASLDDAPRTLLNLPRFPGKADKAIESTLFVEYNKDTGGRERSESGSFGSIVPQARIAKYGYQRCNDAVAARIAQGMSREAAMEKTFVLPGLEDKHPSIRLHAVLACGANVNEATFGSGTQFVPIDVTCEGKPIPPKTRPADQRPPVVKLEVPIKVTRTELSLSPPKHDGACPVDMKLNGKIVADRAGTVEYRWENDKGAKSQTYTQSFGAADTRLVSTTVKIGKKRGGTLGDLKQPGSLDDDGNAADDRYEGSFRLVILSEVANPGARDAEASYAVQCRAGDPDLTPGALFNIGGKGVVRGGSVELTAQNASGTVGGDCLFKFAYDQTNKTAFPAEGFTNIIQVQLLDHKAENQALAANQSRKVLGELRIPDGDHPVKLLLDFGNKVDETNEANNGFEFTAKVSGCKALVPG